MRLIPTVVPVLVPVNTPMVPSRPVLDGRAVSGQRTLVCPTCGQRYLQTNFMVRRLGKVRTDTHRIACEKNNVTPA